MQVLENFHFGGRYIQMGGDGIDHINIYSKGATELGIWLSNFETAPIELERFGKFNTLEGFYHWLKINRALGENPWPPFISSVLEELRVADGYKAKMFASNTRKRLYKYGIPMIDVPDEEFNKNFEEGLLLKLKTYPDWAVRLIGAHESGMVFVHYYCINKKMYYAKRFDWLPDRVYSVLPQVEQFVYSYLQESEGVC